MKKYIFVLKKLTCAGCAAEIERELLSRDEIAAVTLDFLGRELTVYIDRQLSEIEILSVINDIVKKVEPEVEVTVAAHQEKEFRFRDTVISSLRTKETLFNALGIIIFLLAIVNVIPALQLLLYTIGYLIIGKEVIKGAIRKLFSRYLFNEHFLMTVATLGAFAIGEYAEAVAVMLFYQIGRFFESKVVEYSQHSIDEMLKLKPEYANIVRDEEVLKVLPEQVKKGERIFIKPGERVPLDGTVLEGSSTLNNSLLTGESMPEAVTAGDPVLAGAVNLNGNLTVVVEKEYEKSTISLIIDLVRSAKSRKTRTERFITRFAAVYTPVVLVLALLIAVVPPFVLSYGSFHKWFYRALIFLVISCPCALVISVPLSFFAGLAVLIKRGVLVKGGIFLENMARARTVILDKTGTLTKGKIEVTKIDPVDKEGQDELLYYAYLAESYSNHPLAVAVNTEYHKKLSGHGKGANNTFPALAYEEIPGKGVKAVAKDIQILAGSELFLKEEGVELPVISESNRNEYKKIGIALNGEYLGSVEFAESIRSRIKNMIRKLKALGIKKIVMLTGDKEDVALQVAASLGIEQFRANLLPGDKLKYLEEMKRGEKEMILFIGDGINDAPAMSFADTGIAMGGIGSAAAIESADVVLQTDDIEQLPSILTISRKTLNNARQNIIIALGVKTLFLVLGALGLITVWGAVFADVGVTVIAVLNALRLLRYREAFPASS